MDKGNDLLTALANFPPLLVVVPFIEYRHRFYPELLIPDTVFPIKI
jgi:hypothetical protein